LGVPDLSGLPAGIFSVTLSSPSTLSAGYGLLSTGFFGMARHKQKRNSLIRKDIPASVVDFCRSGRAIANTPDLV